MLCHRLHHSGGRCSRYCKAQVSALDPVHQSVFFTTSVDDAYAEGAARRGLDDLLDVLGAAIGGVD